MRIRLYQTVIAVVALTMPGMVKSKEMPRIGLLAWSSCASLPSALMAGLADLGYFPGKTFTLECQSAEQSDDRLLPAARKLVQKGVDVIVALSHPAARAARQATATVPIVMIASGDPVAAGLVSSLAHPGGNVTGSTYYATELTEKRLEILHELVPAAAAVGVLSNPVVAYLPFEQDAKRAAASLKLRLFVHQVAAPAGLARAFAEMARQHVGAVFVLPDLMFSSNAKQIAELALQYNLPTMAWGGWFTKAGCLAAYSAQYAAISRTLASYVDKILKGARPGDLPVDQPTRFDLSVNLKTAKALGLQVPPLILSGADELIE